MRVWGKAVAPGTPGDLERLWFDLNRWPAFVDGFAVVFDRDEDWPLAGNLIWDSTPHGRGRVLEHVVRFEAGSGQVCDVEDERLRGVQTLSFAERSDGSTEVTLALEYVLKERNPFTPLVDYFFVRRSIAASLQRTVDRFARERRGDAGLT